MAFHSPHLSLVEAVLTDRPLTTVVMKRAGQELRAAWERVKTQVEQARVIPPGDRAALTEDPRRAGQSLAEAEDALKKGDRATTRAYPLDAHRSLGAATHLLNHICVFGRS